MITANAGLREEPWAWATKHAETVRWSSAMTGEFGAIVRVTGTGVGKTITTAALAVRARLDGRRAWFDSVNEHG